MKKYLLCYCFFCLSFITALAQQDCVPLGVKHNAVVDYLNQNGFGDGTENGFMDKLIYNTGKMFDEQAFPGGAMGLWELIKTNWQADFGTAKERSYDEVLGLLQSKRQLSEASGKLLSRSYAVLLRSSSHDQLQAELDRLTAGFPMATLPAEEQCLVTSVLDVMRSSAAYWSAYVEQHGVETSWQCLACVVSADVKGALGGFLLGAYICKKLGINNPIKCAQIGAAILGGLYSWLEGLLPRGCMGTCGPGPAGAILGGAAAGAIIGATGGLPGWVQNILLF